MEIQFSANQQYQLDAINSVVELFSGQPQAGGIGNFAVQGEDHYVRIHTSHGQHMLLMRLSDALDPRGWRTRARPNPW